MHGSFGSPMRTFKEAAQAHSAQRTKKETDYLEYLDKMHEPLNQNIRDNIFPHWRDHASLKGKIAILINFFLSSGWQSMNYPATF